MIHNQGDTGAVSFENKGCKFLHWEWGNDRKKLRHGEKIPGVGQGKWPEKIPV
jgi:hypothetical protein